jgi:hypothetical protein
MKARISSITTMRPMTARHRRWTLTKRSLLPLKHLSGPLKPPKYQLNYEQFQMVRGKIPYPAKQRNCSGTSSRIAAEKQRNSRGMLSAAPRAKVPGLGEALPVAEQR